MCVSVYGCVLGEYEQGGVGASLPLTQEAAEFHSRSELKREEGLSHVKKTSSRPSCSL